MADIDRQSAPTLHYALPRRQTNPSGTWLNDLVRSNLILAEDLESLSQQDKDGLRSLNSRSELLNQLVERRLLTEYQVGRIEAGSTFGLVLGNYRILDRIGAGGMGVVFRAEHIRMRRLVAVKVLPMSPDRHPRLLSRFLTEMRAVAQLQHPNIVGAIDAGESVEAGHPERSLHFFVMEYVPGRDLEEYVREQGPLPLAQACDLAHQVAAALNEAHKHGLVHRDIKPSNIKVTPEGQAKLLDFGLARRFTHGSTEPGVLLGSLDYMAPEQVQDAHSVDIRADLFALGGVFFLCLTGQPPFPMTGNLLQELNGRLRQAPPSVRTYRPDLPPEIEEIVRQMMALRPDDRPQNPQAVMRALLPFLKPDLRDHGPLPFLEERSAASWAEAGGRTAGAPTPPRVLLVDDDASVRFFCRQVLQAEGLHCTEAADGAAALNAVRAAPFDLLVLDVDMPEVPGPDVCRRLRQDPPHPNLKVILASGTANADTMAQMLLCGADDFLTKPFSVIQLCGRVKAALRLKDAQDRSDQLRRHLRTVNSQLEISLSERNGDLTETRKALMPALALLVDQRTGRRSRHPQRLQAYVRCLGAEVARDPAFSGRVDQAFLETLQACAPLKDIGMVGLPDHILLKPGRLDPEERILMQTHTRLGAETLQEVARLHPSAQDFLALAVEVVLHHHERHDGTGYPDRLEGEAIPLAARLVALADVYDALRSRRVYKPALNHASAVDVILQGFGTQFDPALEKVFRAASPVFETIFEQNPD